MSLHNAIRFIRLAEKDQAERKRCYAYNSRAELLETLGFSEAEFEDAVNMRLVKCQEEEDALNLQELRFWFAMLG